MLTGLPPFYDENTNEMYRKILTEPLTFPDNREYMPPAARDLLTQLLDRRPDKRLGVNGAAEIKAHDFFSGIDWRKLLRRGYEPLFKPNVVRYNLVSLTDRTAANTSRLRLTNWTPPTSTANLPRRLQPTRMSMVLCYRKLRNNNLQAGRTTVPWLVLVMLAVASRTLLLAVSGNSRAILRRCGWWQWA